MPDIIPEKSFIGIDVGSQWIKAVEIRKGKGGYVVTKVVRKEVMTPESDTPEQRQKAAIATVTALLKENGLPGKKVVLGLPGYQIFVRKMRLPAATEDRLAKIIVYEARQQIPFPLDKIRLDYHVKPIPDTPEVEVLLVGSKKEIVADYMKFIKGANLNPKYLDVTPVALFNFHKYIDPTLAEEATALINIGAATTDISIVRDGWLSFTRTAPVGGNDLTRNIARALNIDFAAAEKLKLKHGRIPLEYEIALGIEESGGSEEDTKVRQAITTGLDRLVGEIRRTFDYYISQPDGVTISRVVLSGGGSLLQNIDGYIGEKLAVPVITIKNQPTWARMEELKDQFGEELSWVTTAVGLALTSAPKVPDLIRVDFLPQEAKDIRNFQEKRLQISIAALLLIIVIVIGSMFGTDEIAIKRQQTTDLRNETNKLKTGKDQYDKLINQKEELVKVYDDLRLVVGKRDYWLDILAELNKITPSDVWFTKITSTVDYKLTIEGKSLSEGSVSAFATSLGKDTTYVQDSSGTGLVKFVSLSPPVLDPRLDKTVTSFIFEITCKPPKSAQPKETPKSVPAPAAAARPGATTATTPGNQSGVSSKN
jgi:type IV pilus assembly protein PilM